VIFTALMLAAAPVVAQPKPHAKTIREELDASAKRSWDTAVELYGISDFEGARAEFQRIYDATKNTRVLYNVAVCEKDLKRYKAAADTLHRALEKKKDLPKDDVTAMETALKTIEPFITKVEIVANEAGATIYVDDVLLGTTPFAEHPSVDAGSHVVKIVKAGFLDESRKVTFTTAGANKLTFDLQPTVQRTFVTINIVGAPNASVYIDDKEAGPAPFSGEVEAGRHVIEGRATEFVPTKQSVTLVYKQPATFVLSLAPMRHEGVLRVVAKPEGATIEIDGHLMGRSEWEGPLASKTGHALVVKKDGYYVYSSEVTLADDQKRSLPITLNPEKNWVFWVIGASAVVAGGTVAAYFALRPSDQKPVPGTLQAGGSGVGTAHFPF
jgi:hypothetical protein